MRLEVSFSAKFPDKVTVSEVGERVLRLLAGDEAEPLEAEFCGFHVIEEYTQDRDFGDETGG